MVLTPNYLIKVSGSPSNDQQPMADAGSVQTEIRADGTASDSAFGTEKAIRDALTAVANDTYSRSDSPITSIVDPTQLSITYNASARTFSVTNSGTDVFIDGVKATPSSETTSAHADTTAEYWLVYTSGSTTATVTTSPDFSTQAIAGRVYYLATADGGPDYIGFEETHSSEWTASMHANQHRTIGAKLVDSPLGCALGDYTLDSDTDADMQFSVAAGTMYDEDIVHAITALSTGSYTVAYRDGADSSGIMKWSDSETLPYMSGTYAYYNELSSGTWSRTELSNGDFTNLWVFAWTRNDNARDIVVFLGQNTYSTQLVAQNETLKDLSLALGAPEQVPLFKITIKASASYGSTGKIEFKTIEDLRGIFTGASVGNSVQTQGTMSLQDADNVDITGGTISGIAATATSLAMGGQSTNDILISGDSASTSDAALVSAGYVNAHASGGGGTVDMLDIWTFGG